MTTQRIAGETVFPGQATGPLLYLGAPLSFWGGIDPATGVIINTRHPDHGRSISGSVVILEPIGSSSSSSVLLELIHAGLAPAAIVLTRPDAILVVGCLVAREMGYTAPPVVLLAPDQLAGDHSVAIASVEAHPGLAALVITAPVD